MIHEVPDKATLTGGAIILSGILMFNFGGKINGSLFTKKRAGHSLIDKTSRAE
jgi:hypothetical protein